jgi:putative peptidoglycan lipid II flippase
MLGVTIGVMLGGLAQLGMQLPTLYTLGFRYRWHLNFRDPRLMMVLKLAVPAAIAGAAVQVNVLTNGVFASSINGGRVWLNCAFRLMQFPIGVFGVAIATVTLPAVAKLQANGDLNGFGATVQEALRRAFYLTLPAAVGLCVLARPLIHLIYGGLNFHSYDVMYAAHALQAYTVGLSAYAAIKVLVPCFYALDQPRTPFNVSMLGIVFNLIFNSIFMFYFKMGIVGLALSTGLIAQLNFLQLLLALNKRVNCGSMQMWTTYFIKVTCATLACGVTAAAVELVTKPASQPFWGSLAAILLCIILAAGAYFIVSVWMGLPEATEMANMIGRKLGIQMANRARPKAVSGSGTDARLGQGGNAGYSGGAYGAGGYYGAGSSSSSSGLNRPQQSSSAPGSSGSYSGGPAPVSFGPSGYGAGGYAPQSPSVPPKPAPPMRRPPAPAHRRRRPQGPPGRRRV